MIYFGHVIHEHGCLHFFKDLLWFFQNFLAFYVAFCAYRPIPIRVVETDPSQCPPSRWPRPRLWTMTWPPWPPASATDTTRCYYSAACTPSKLSPYLEICSVSVHMWLYFRSLQLCSVQVTYVCEPIKMAHCSSFTYDFFGWRVICLQFPFGLHVYIFFYLH